MLERALAEKSGMGWIGKNTMLINKQTGSWFFHGELFAWTEQEFLRNTEGSPIRRIGYEC